jgi:ribosomal protein L11 methyltransferase
MNNNIWKEISINTSFSINEMLYNFLEEQGLEGITINKEESKTQSTLKAYFLEEEINEVKLLDIIKDKTQSIYQEEIDIKINLLQEEDWENDWKEFFNVFKVGKNLVIRPFWQQYQPNNNDIVISFDPGGFFGSTPHPSTKLCLEEIESISEEIQKKEDYKVLDLGVGSGILSLALYSLGLKQITAIDIDPIAIRTSEDNFKLNNMNVDLFLGDLDICNETYDIIAGNLLAETIIELSENISKKTNKNGIFIGAGININQELDVIEALENTGFTIKNKRYQDEWVLINARKNS